MILLSNKAKVSLDHYHKLSVVEGLNNSQVAKMLNVDEASVRRAKDRYAKKYGYLVDAGIAQAFRDDMEQPFILDGNWAVTGDFHSPLTDMELVNFFLTTARNKGIKNLLIIGDFLNGDMLSNYYPKQENAGLEIELIHANYLMGKLLETFDRIVFLKGNHDYRYVKGRDYTITFREAMLDAFSALENHGLERIEFSNLDHCFINHSTGRWYLCHPKAYSQVPGTTGLKLAAKWPAHHIVTAHSHHCALMYQKDGAHLVVEIGGFFDADQTQYLQESTTFPKWTNGFGLMTDNEGFVLYPGNNRRSVQDQLHGDEGGFART